jgi:uncharacterized transporter YbjL
VFFIVTFVASIPALLLYEPLLKHHNYILGAGTDTRIAFLVAIHDWTFLLGPAFCAGFGTGLLLGYLTYKSGLVPRRMATLGPIGGPLIFASATAILFGAYKNGSGPATIAALPEIAWELSLGIYLIVRGFKPSPILAQRIVSEYGSVAQRPSRAATR